jgi:hypothetical protein
MSTHIRACLAGALGAAVLAAAGPAAALSLFVEPMTFSATVEENLLPGGSVFSDTQVVDSGVPGSAESVDLLHSPALGQNFSGRSTQITRAFTSAQADVHGDGGVGVTNWVAGNPVAGNFAVGQLAARTLWTQTFTNTGTDDIVLSLNFHIPGLQVGLIGVAPNRNSISATETAIAEAVLDSSINRSDGSFVKGRSFEFGLDLREYQVLLGPGTYSNFADVRPIISGSDLGFDPFVSLRDNGSQSTPVFTIDPLAFSFTLGTLHPGDILSYVYTLSASGTTLGGEHGYDAFLGDPFDLVASGGSLSVSAEPVPEPGAAVLLLASLAALLARRA